MRITSMLILILIVAGCSADRQVVGRYHSYKDVYSFQFNTNHTFRYQKLEGEADLNSKGIWQRISEDIILITSDIPVIDIPVTYELLDTSNTKFVSVSIELKVENGENLSQYSWFAASNDRIPIDGHKCNDPSPIKIQRPKRSLSLLFYKIEGNGPIDHGFPLWANTLKFDKAVNHNIKLKVTLKDIYFNYQPFNKEKVEIGKRYIRFFNNVDRRKWVKVDKISGRGRIFIGD